MNSVFVRLRKPFRNACRAPHENPRRVTRESEWPCSLPCFAGQSSATLPLAPNPLPFLKRCRLVNGVPPGRQPSVMRWPSRVTPGPKRPTREGVKRITRVRTWVHGRPGGERSLSGLSRRLCADSLADVRRANTLTRSTAGAAPPRVTCAPRSPKLFADVLVDRFTRRFVACRCATLRDELRGNGETYLEHGVRSMRCRAAKNARGPASSLTFVMLT